MRRSDPGGHAARAKCAQSSFSSRDSKLAAERYLAPEARAALEDWLTKADIRYGAVFRRLEKHGGIGERMINTEEVARTFKRIAGILDLDASRPLSRISGHSTRIGAAQDLTAAGAALPEIMVAGGWKSPQMPAHYARKLDARHDACNGGSPRRESARPLKNMFSLSSVAGQETEVAIGS
jgi:hypothetical protein